MWAELKASLSEESVRGESEREGKKVRAKGRREDGNLPKQASDKNKVQAWPADPHYFGHLKKRGKRNKSETTERRQNNKRELLSFS